MKYTVTQVFSPAHFSVTPVLKNPKVLQLQDELKELAINSMPVKVPLEIDDEVITFVKSIGCWERAFVRKPSVVKNNVVKHYLNLVDHGIAITALEVYLAPHSFFKKIPCASFQFRLHGILPKPTRETDKWMAETQKWVQLLLFSAKVKLEIVLTDEKFTSGDLLVPYKGELRLLSRLILKSNCAVYNEELFIQKYVIGKSHKLQQPIQAVDSDSNDSSNESFKSATSKDLSEYSSHDNQNTSLVKANHSKENEHVDSIIKNCTTNSVKDFRIEKKDSISKIQKTCIRNAGEESNNILPVPPHAIFSDVKGHTSGTGQDGILDNSSFTSTVSNKSESKNIKENSKGNLSKPIEQFFSYFSSSTSLMACEGSNNGCEFDSSIISSKSSSSLEKSGNESSQSSFLTSSKNRKTNSSVNKFEGAKHSEYSWEKNSKINVHLDGKSKGNNKPTKKEKISITKSEVSITSVTATEEMISHFAPPLTLFEKESQLGRYYRILVRSSYGEIAPVLRVNDLPINEYIFSVLRRVHIELFPVQLYCISCILNGQNTVIISSHGSGKTFGYVIPIMDKLHQQSEKNSIPCGYGPLVIILCSGSKHIDEVYNLCKKYSNLNSTPGMARTRILTMHGNNEKVKLDPLTKGCEILITTPHCLVRTLRGELATNLERLQCLVIDDSDFLLEPPFETEVQALLQKMKNVSKLRRVQSIFAGEKFTPKLLSIVQPLKDYTLIIGSHIEAALYAKVKPTVVFSTKDNKMESLLGILEPIKGKERLVIVCRSGEEAVSVGNDLEKHGIFPLIAHTAMLNIEVASVDEEWVASSYPLLVCSDSVLVALQNVYDATTLIHYSLTAKSKATFGLRFSVLKDHYRNHFQDTQSKANLRSIIMCDEETQRQIPHLVKDLLRLGCNVDEKILKYSEQVETEVEISKPSTGICENVLGTGCCAYKASCLGRHVLVPSLDLTTHYKYGQVIFQPIKGLSGNSFSARLISNTDVDGETIHYENLIPKITSAMEEYYEIPENRCRLGNIGIGDVCAVSSFTEVFFRARVEQCLAFDDNNIPKIVRIRLIDVGTALSIKVVNLWELPKDLAIFADQAVVSYVMGIAPIDFDYTWSSEASKSLEKLLLAPLKKNSRWEGTIRFALSSAIILDQVRLVHILPEHRSTVDDTPVNEILISKGVVVKNPDHLTLLSQLHEKAGIEPQKFVGKRLKTETKYAHFGSEKLPSVSFSAATSTKSIYLRNTQFYSLLQEVEELCAIEGEAILKKQNKFLIEPGHLCLAKNKEEEWNRAQVNKVDNESATCFFVDYGDSEDIPLTNLTPISEKLLNKLPFQAIECTLGGVKHPYPCPPDIVDLIYDFTCDGNEECLVQYQAKDSQSSPYEINLLNSKGKSLNKQLVDNGMLNAVKNTGIFLEDIEVLDITTAKEEEEEEGYDEENSSSDIEYEVESEGLDYRNSWNDKQLKEIKLVEPSTYIELVSTVLLSEDIEPEDSNFLMGLLKGQREKTSRLVDQKKKVVELIDDNSVKQISSSDSNDDTIQNKAINNNQMNVVIEKVELCTSVNQNQYTEEFNDGWTLRKPKQGLRPLVQWSQDSYYIKLKFVVLNVQDITVTGSPRTYSVMLITENGSRYTSSCELFGAIDHMKATTQTTPFHCYLVFPKLVPTMWPRLSLSPFKNSSISMDPDSKILDESYRDNNYVHIPSKLDGKLDFDSDDSCNEGDDEIDF